MKTISKKKKIEAGVAIISAVLVFAGILASTTSAHDTQTPLSLHEEPSTPPIKYYGDVWFNLSAIDPGVPSSGVAFCKYAVNRLPTGSSPEVPQWENFINWTTYIPGENGTSGENVVFDGNISGVYEVIYYSQDKKGNIEQDKHAYFEITVDITASESTFHIGGYQLNPPTTG